MTDDSTITDAVPGTVSDLYRATATEKPPETLDQTVLAEARSALRKQSVPGVPWYRPAIFIGLFGLCLALLIEFSVISKTGPGNELEMQETIDPSAESVISPKEACSEDERADPATWWACIQELEAAGSTSAAEEELRRLLSDYPGFESNPASRP